MAIEIRPIREDEVEEATFINRYAFNEDRRPKALEESAGYARLHFRTAATLAVILDGKMTACMRVFPFTMIVNGNAVPTGGVASVASLPEQRRKGHVGAMLRRAIADMRERGQAVSALYTPHPALYRKHGWEIAANALEFSLKPKDVRPIRDAKGVGCRRVDFDGWALLDGIYRKHVQERNGPLLRTEMWWREAVLGGTREPWDAAVCESEGGEALGYVVYRTRRVDTIEFHLPHTSLRVRELVALDGEAYLALIGYLVSHDMHDRIAWYAPPDEPFLAAIDDPFRVETAMLAMFMMRLVDVPKALESRGYGPQANGKRLVLSVRDDESAPWNAGTWEVINEGGAARTKATPAEADLTLEARTLAAVYSGHLRMSDAARVGLVEVGRREALATADEVFAVRYPPFCMDWF